MIIDYLKEHLTTESQEIEKDVRWKAPNQHKIKHISKFSMGDKLVYDRYSGEPHNQKKGYVARYHRCRKDGNKQKLYTYNPKSEMYDDKECKIVPKSVMSESYEYCDTLGLATPKSVAHALFGNGTTYRETINTQDHTTTPQELVESFKNDVTKLYRTDMIQRVCNNDIELYVRERFDYGESMQEINEQDHNRERTVRGINNLIQEVNSTL